MPETSPIQIFFSDEFKSRLRTLAKRYRSIRNDLQNGKIIGDQIKGIGSTVFKARLQNSDIQKGKSGGYRVIYQIKDNRYILMVIIYFKSDQTDISTNEIRDIINSRNF